jgi:hypothetical protein
LYSERGIKKKELFENKIFDFAQYSQQLWFNGQIKKEEELTANVLFYKFCSLNYIHFFS